MTSHVVVTTPEESNPAIDIYRQLRGLIVSGQLGANERLPTVRQTAADLKVAQGTAAKAYKMLEQDGLVVTRTAAGTRVADSAAVLPQSVIRRIRELVDEAALYQALLDKHIGGAGLDVFAQEPPNPNLPVYQLPNVFVMPHTAGSTDGTSRKRAQFAADNLDRYARGETLLAQVTTSFT